MAFAVPTVGSATSAGGGSTTVTAPTTVLGDLMFLLITGSQSGTGLTFTPPAGWTLVGSANSANLYAKVALVGDVGTQNYTVTDTGAVNFTGTSAVIAVVPGPYTSVPAYSHVQSFSGTGTITDSTGITPVEQQGILLQFVADTNTTAIRTSSAYAVTNSNPSWTELIDTGSLVSGSAHSHVAVAYGNWTATSGTATGACTFSISGTSNGIFATVHIPGIPIAVDPLSMISTLPATVFIRLMVVTALFVTATVGTVIISIVAAKWQTLSKHISSWINQNKS